MRECLSGVMRRCKLLQYFWLRQEALGLLRRWTISAEARPRLTQRPGWQAGGRSATVCVLRAPLASCADTLFQKQSMQSDEYLARFLRLTHIVLSFVNICWRDNLSPNDDQDLGTAIKA